MGFDITNFLNSESKKEMKTDWKPIKISVTRLHPAPDKANFYHADDKEVRELAESIELVGLQQYPVIRPIEGTDDYEVIAGHKRRLALLRLLAEGKTEYELVPCKVVSPDDIQNELILIFTNSTQRERTDYEKMREIERVRELLEEYQKTHELPGRKQTLIAELLGTSKTKVGTLDNINRNLSEPFKEEFASGNISTSTANEIAGLKREKQQELYEKYQETGTVQAKEVKKEKSRDMTKEELELLYDWLEIWLETEITEKQLKENYGRSYHGGSAKNGIFFSCSPYGVRTNQSRYMAWKRVAEALKEIQERKREKEPEETPDILCGTCNQEGDCVGEKTHEDGCLGYKERREAPEEYGLAEVNKLLQEYKKGSCPPGMLQTRKIIVDALKLLQEKLENE